MLRNESRSYQLHPHGQYSGNNEQTSMSNQRWNNAVVGRDEQRRRKKQAVLAAGAKLFAEKGYNKTSLEDIAAALNVTKRALYYYFDGKDDILFECHKLALRVAEEIVDLSLDHSIPVLERIDSVVGKYADWINSDFGACLVLIHESSMEEDRSRVLRATKSRLDSQVREMIADGITDGAIRQCDPKLATAAIFGALNWIPFWNRNNNTEVNSKIRVEFTAFINNALRNH